MSSEQISIKQSSTSSISRRWRVVDIVVASIIAVASGVIFWGWDFVSAAPLDIFGALTPGFEGILNGMWLFAGPLAAIIVRKPGAALYAEVIAAVIETLLGNPWGIMGSLIVGIVQGLFTELAFAVVLWKVYNLGTTLLAGAFAGLGCGLFYWFTNPAWSVMRALVYTGTSIVSGVILAGIVVWIIYKALAATGVLERFAAGRAAALV